MPGTGASDTVPFMRLAAGLLALMIAASPCEGARLAVPYAQQAAPSTCAATAFAMVARFAGVPAPLTQVVRSVFVGPQGIAWLDLADFGSTVGLETLVVQLNDGPLNRLIDGGRPVIVSVVEGGAKHAIVVVGRDERGYDIMDSARPERRRLTTKELGNTWARGQAILVHALNRAPVNSRWEDLRRQNRRFRAIEWGLRAEAAEVAGGDPLFLYGRALAEDPTIPELYARRAQLHARLGHRSAAEDDLRVAASLREKNPKSERPGPGEW